MSSHLDPLRHSTPLQFFLATNRRELKWLGLIAFLYSAAMVSMLGATYYLGNVVDLLRPVPHGNIHFSLIAIVVGLVGYEAGFRLGHIVEVLTSSRIRATIKRALLDHVTTLSFSYFSDRFSGQIAHKIVSTTDALTQMAEDVTNEFIENGSTTIISAIALSFVNVYLGLFLLAWGILFSICILPYAKRMNARANDYAECESRTTGVFVDFFTNIASVKVYGGTASRTAAYAQIEAEKKAYRALGFWAVLAYNYMGVSIIILGAGLLWITTFLYTHSLISIGGIVFVAGVVLRIVGVAWDLGKSTIGFIRQRGEAQQNLHDLIVAPQVVDGTHMEVAPPAELQVEYRDVTFAYGENRNILEHFSLVVRPNEKIGIVGLSGAGKTTLAGLLLRFFDVERGSVLINNVDVKDLSQEFLRSHISFVSQDTSLFHTTIFENISYSTPGASRAAVEHAARLAYADEFIQLLPQGYDSVVGERGIKLSGGQRQRIAIARAILADRPLFLLDEATSALDSDSEAKIQRGLETLMEGKTVIAIAHRLSTLAHLNRIIFLENGKIIEDGTHQELLTANGKYAALWHMQAGGFLPD